MKKSIVIPLLTLFLSMPIKGNCWPQIDNNSDTNTSDTNTIVLKEVIVLSKSGKEIKSLSSDTPKRNSQIRGSLVIWMGVLIDSPNLNRKELKTFSIFSLIKKKIPQVIEIDFYTLGNNGLPLKKLNNPSFEFNLYKKGWNEFEIPSHIVIPEKGIIIAFRFKKHSKDWQNQVNSIGLGTYMTDKQSYIINHHDWEDFPIYEPYQNKYSKRVSMMIKISAIP